jgi:hypothetical protein
MEVALDGDDFIWKVPELLVGSHAVVRARVKRLTQTVIKAGSWEGALGKLAMIDIRRTDLPIATLSIHNFHLIPCVSFAEISQGLGEGCAELGRDLVVECTRRVVVDGLSYLWIVFGLCLDPTSWMFFVGAPKADFNRAVLPALIRAAGKWEEEMNWLEQRAKGRPEAVDLGISWSDAFKEWIRELDPAWATLADWGAIDSAARKRVALERLGALNL